MGDIKRTIGDYGLCMKYVSFLRGLKMTLLTIADEIEISQSSLSGKIRKKSTFSSENELKLEKFYIEIGNLQTELFEE